MSRRFLTCEEGYTVSEMLVVSILLAIIVVAAYLLMDSATGMADQIQARTIAADEGRAIMDRITREMRQAYEIQDNKGAFVDAQARTCTFYTDVNRDGTPEMVKYRVQQNFLYRSQATATTALPPWTFGSFGPEEAIVESLDGNFTGNVFEYYSSEYDEATNEFKKATNGKPEQISAVSLRLKTGATVNKKTAFVDLSTWVKVRAVHNTID